MDFFEAQDRAHRQTKTLVVFFSIAVILIVTALYLVVTGVWSFALDQGAREAMGSQYQFDVWNWKRFLAVGVVTVFVISVSSISKIMQMRQGGGYVARSLGGVRVSTDTKDFNERQLLNVVEEMSIASGTPMPEVYILQDELGINAFAAGFSPNDAAVAVTRGCLDTLDRDELQGVIAHEFSHILNGDMRLNIKLAGVLFGILVMAIIGRGVLHSLRFSTMSGGGNRKGNSGGIVIAIVITALAIMVIGYIGVFFGRLIQSAVSRQREFLADASAVQFTRNPGGIVGALKKIGGLSEHSRIANAKAMNMAHMFFGNIRKAEAGFFSMASHPPLLDRIRAIDPQFDGKFPAVSHPAGDKPKPQKSQRSRPVAAPVAGMAAVAGSPSRSATPRDRFKVGLPKEQVAQTGQVKTDQLGYARSLIEAMPPEILAAREDSGLARAVILALVFDRDPMSLVKQMNAVRIGASQEVAGHIQRMAPLVRALRPEQKLPALELVLPALYGLDQPTYARFTEVLDQCILSDHQMDFGEFILKRMVHHQVAPRIDGQEVDTVPIRYRTVAPLSQSYEIVLSFVVSKSSRDPVAQRKAFEQAGHAIPGLGAIQFLPEKQLNYESLNQALDRLGQATFHMRRVFLETCLSIVSEDGTITLQEMELVRALAVTLDCPMPPLIPGAAGIT